MDRSKWTEIGQKAVSVIEIIIKVTVKAIIGLVKAVFEAFRR